MDIDFEKDLPIDIIAEKIAMKAHIGQVDKIGEPYIAHPVRVANKAIDMAENFADDGVFPELADEKVQAEICAIAYLHDVIEDTDYSVEDLLRYGISRKVVGAVELLSKRKGEPNVDYYERLKEDLYARIVKLADIADNSDEARLALIEDAEVRDRLKAKYRKARGILAF